MPRNDPALATQEGYGGNLAGGLFGAIVSPVRVRYRSPRSGSSWPDQPRPIASINGSFRVTFADEAVPGGVRELGSGPHPAG
jgi:hypothetical protein